jgi:hypothetical protein
MICVNLVWTAWGKHLFELLAQKNSTLIYRWICMQEMSFCKLLVSVISTLPHDLDVHHACNQIIPKYPYHIQLIYLVCMKLQTLGVTFIRCCKIESWDDLAFVGNRCSPRTFSSRSKRWCSLESWNIYQNEWTPLSHIGSLSSKGRLFYLVWRIEMAAMVVSALVRATSNAKPSQFISVGPDWQQDCDSNFSQQFKWWGTNPTNRWNDALRIIDLHNL